MNEPISLFDIPLIVDLIGNYLSKRDYANCTLVSKSFYSAFNPLLWNTVKNEFKSFWWQHKLSLQKNGHLIRKLTIADDDLYGQLEYLAGNGWPCRNLIEFKCTQSSSTCNQILFALALVHLNKSLRKCILASSEGGTVNCEYRIFTMLLWEHCNLTTLVIQDLRRVSRKTYESLLKNLPFTVQVFELQLTYGLGKGETDDDEGDPDEGDESDESNPDENESVNCRKRGVWAAAYPQLRSLTVRLSHTGCETISLLSLIQRCPALQKLGITQSYGDITDFITTIFKCPQLPSTLNELYLEDTLTTDAAWKAIIPILRGRIKSFNVNSSCFQTFPYKFYDAVPEFWVENLEAIRFDGDMHIDRKEIKHILRACTSLKSFAVFCRTDRLISGLKVIKNYEYDEDDDIDDDNYDNDENLIGVGPDWNCLELERLEMRFLDFRLGMFNDKDLNNYNDEAKYIFLNQQKWTVDGVKRAYQQLGRLTKLKHLRVGWRSRAEYKNSCNIDMSVKNGLDFLKGLKELQVLDVGAIRQVNIGQEEVEWISENWPALKEIRGLITKDDVYEYEFRSFFDNDLVAISGDEDHIRWLKNRRPHIFVS